MTKYYYPIPLIANFLHQLQWYLFIHHTFRRKYPLPLVCTVELIMFAVYIGLISMLQYMSAARMLLPLVMQCVAFCLMFHGKWQRIVFVVTGLWVTSFASEALGALFVFLPGSLAGHLNQQPVLLQIQLYVACLFFSGILVWLFYGLIHRNQLQVPAKQWLLCALFLFCQGGILFAFMQELTQDPDPRRRNAAVFVTFATLIMDLFLVQYVLSAIRRSQLQQKQNQLAQQMEFLVQRYSAVTEEYNTVRRMRHDIAKHLSAMEGLIRSGRHEEAASYFCQLQGRYQASGPICEHPVADALLLSYREKAQSLGVRLETDVSIPSSISITSTDLICALGNLLDNALESCAGQSQQQIRLTCALLRGYLVIRIENPMAAPQPKSRRIPELERGMGSSILYSIAQTYQGAYETHCQDGRFQGCLSLKAQEVAP